MYAKVAATIQRFDLFSRDSPIIVGVSGGADSLCLLDCLAHLEYPLIVAYLDHGLRAESTDDIEVIHALSERYGYPFVTRALARGEIEATAGSLEEAARLARYNFLADVALEHEASYVAVGHTVDDQVETVLMHLLRGSGPSGLRGMQPETEFTKWVGIASDADILLSRPLLECTHKETLEHCRQQGLEPLYDATNEDLTFFRNRLRHELLPLLETYNPGIRRVLIRLADVMQEQVAFNQMKLESIWSEVVKELPATGYLINVGSFGNLHPFMQGSLLRMVINRLTPEVRDLGQDATLRAVEWMREVEGALNLPGGLVLEKYGQGALMRKSTTRVTSPDHPCMDRDQRLTLMIPGDVELDNGWRLSARKAQINKGDFSNLLTSADHWQAVFKADGFPDRLTIRTRVAGDRIQLPAVEGTTKVADLMINRHIPKQLRSRWPLVTINEKVLWVPAIQRSDEMLVDSDTNQVIVIDLHREGEVNDVEASV